MSKIILSESSNDVKYFLEWHLTVLPKDCNPIDYFDSCDITSRDRECVHHADWFADDEFEIENVATFRGCDVKVDFAENQILVKDVNGQTWAADAMVPYGSVGLDLACGF